MSQIQKGAALTYANILLSNVVGLLLSPFIIKSLGASEYGLYTLIGAFVAYLTLLDFGLNNSIVRFVSKYRAQNDPEGERRFIGTTAWVYAGISVALVLIGLLLYTQLDALFSQTLSAAEMDRAKIMFLILIANMAITIPGGAFQALCNAYEMFVFPRLVNILKYLVRVGLVLAVLFGGGKAIALVIVDTVLNILIILVFFLYVVYKLKIKISLRSFDITIVREIFSYSVWVFVYGIVHLFQWNAGQVILGMTTTTTIVGIYGVGVMLGGYYNAFAGALNSMLVPKAMQMIVKDATGAELTHAMVRVGRVNGYLLFLILTGFVLFGRAFILLWLGPTYLPAWEVALLMMAGMTMLLFQVFGNSILEAQKKNRFKSVMSLVSVSVAVVVGYYLSKDYGLMGVILPLFTAMILNSMAMNVYFTKVFSFDFLAFFKQTIGRQAVFYGLLCAFFYWLLQWVSLDSWVVLIGLGTLYVGVYFVSSWLFILNDYEKSLFRRFLK